MVASVRSNEEKDAKRKQRRTMQRESALNTEQQPPRATPGGLG